MRSIIIDKEELRNKVNNNLPLVTEAQQLLLDNLTPKTTVLEIESIGQISEYLSKNGNNHKVTLCTDDRLCFAFRDKILPDTEVVYLNVSHRKIIVTKPVYDYVIIHNLAHIPSAMTLAKLGIINTVTGELMEVSKKSKKRSQAESDEVNVESAKSNGEEDIKSDGNVVEPESKESDDTEYAEGSEGGGENTDIPVIDTENVTE